MAKAGTKYELLVRDIFDQIVKQDFQGVQNVDVQHDVKIEGKSGNKHQVDVYWEFYLADAKHCAILEVKDKLRPVPKLDMESFVFRLQDIPGQPRGYFISKSGFQSGAEKLARQNGIKIMTLDKPDEEFWRGKMQDLILHQTYCFPKIENLRTQIDNKWFGEHPNKTSIIEKIKGGAFLVNETVLCDENGDPQQKMIDIINGYIRANAETQDKKHIAHIFENQYSLLPGKDRAVIKIESLEFDLMFHKYEDTLHIEGNSIICYVLKDIVEQTVRGIDNIGHARESRPILTESEVEKNIQEIVDGL